MSHPTAKEEVVLGDQNGQKRTNEMEEAGGSSNTKETPTKKVKAGGSAKKEKDKCVETCARPEIRVYNSWQGEACR